MKELIIATNNQGKVKEFSNIFSKVGYEVKSLKDFPNLEEVEETGTTFEENAILKAKSVATALSSIVIADDSGLEVDALQGEPGVYSARYAGLEKNDIANYEKVLQKLKDVPYENRTARFVCALAIAKPDGTTFTVRGTCEGSITTEPAGDNGFGYDPIFFVPLHQKTMAQLTHEEKNNISHRGNAIKQLMEQWSSFKIEDE
ncbi:XTP/dITP diphosphatase [Sutcliffiella cohnii]|uniref:XTP/dITP diphosphatase n=1 Tax=Sutcliffiella cohnii TaxID=33932 RepID=UPI002E220C06|nr:XTP/dITP diphosphatase [Sutcliffiella cohnii]MED4016320.1 XTP/dITP diphosphatase [Sutcliffiella cohnii]